MKTFGTLRLEKRRWFLQVEPHVAIRAKRVFAGISRDSETGVLEIADTVPNCRDLLWFLDRFPLEVDPGRMERLKERASTQVERENIVDELLRGVGEPRTFDLTSPPRGYQREAAELALASRGTLVGDELGVGKTHVGLAWLTDPRTRPALVVCPTHLQRQWEEKIAEFAPQLTTHVLRQGTPYDYATKRQKKGLKLPLGSTHPDVLITSYAKLVGWSPTLSKVIRGVIFEEAHELRSGPLRGAGENKKGSEKGSACQEIANAALFRLLLSATPIMNYGGEIYWVMQCTRPHELGTVEEFRKEWCAGGGDKARLEEPEAFSSFLKSQGMFIRRSRKDVGREIPELTTVVEHVDADPEALSAVESSATELAKIILNRDGATLARGEQMRAGGELDWRMRQATGIAKAPHVVTYVKMLLESEHRILLAGWHRAVFDVWLDGLKEYKPVLFTGSESDNQKRESKKAFCEGAARVMIMSLRSGAGLDGLQYSGCKTVVHGELDWAWGIHLQLTGRIHRDGQPDPVLSLFLVSDSGSDPIVADVLDIKRQQLEGLIDPFGEAAPVEPSEATKVARMRRFAEELLRRRAA